MPARKYTEEQIVGALMMRERGLSYGQIAVKTGMTDKAVSHHCLMRGVDSPATSDKPHEWKGVMTYVRNGVTVRRFTPDEDRKILDLARDGLSRNEIARRMGRAHHSIRARLAALARKDQRAENAKGVEI